MDTESLLRSLSGHRVRYIVIGASAFPAHGYARVTLDFDILIQPTLQNAQRVLAALSDIGYDVSDLSPDELLHKKILFRQYILDVDIHPDALGVTFDEVWRNRTRRRIGRTIANFASLDDLIKMKQAANRPKDREDLKALRAIKALQKKSRPRKRPASK